MKKALLKARYVAFITMMISICAIESETKIPLIVFALSSVVLFISTFVKEDEREEHTK